jgi:short-subunit dehydrogenase
MKNSYYTLITGASEGLGKFLALECAARKMNLILVSLSGTGLVSLSSFIERNFDVNVEYIETDLSYTTSCEMLKSEIERRNLRVNILINNAGLGSTSLFEEQSAEFYDKQIRLNVISTTLLTRSLINNLERSAPSHILNVGSLASFFHLPAKQVYGGTKAYIYAFSKSLHKEFSKKGVKVSVLCHGGINTNLRVTLYNRSMPWLAKLSVMNPEDVARIALTGLLSGKKVIIPGSINNIFRMINRIVPEYLENLIVGERLKDKNSKHTRIAPALAN